MPFDAAGNWVRDNTGSAGYMNFADQFGGGGGMSVSPEQLARVGAGSQFGVGPTNQVAQSPGFMQGFTGGQASGAPTSFMGGAFDKGGWGNTAIGLGQAGLGFYLGNKQLGIAEDQLKTSKQQFADQFGAQRQQVNKDIEDQARNRYANNPTAAPNPEEYYEKHRIR